MAVYLLVLLKVESATADEFFCFALTYDVGVVRIKYPSIKKKDIMLKSQKLAIYLTFLHTMKQMQSAALHDITVYNE